MVSMPPCRPLVWPPIIERLAAVAPDPARLYIVGGPVRDVLRQRPIHDIDLASLDDGLSVARRLADRLKGAYYPIDSQRRTGRIILKNTEEQIVIDVASLRGTDLLDDLQARDFTVNAMAAALDRLGEIIDPLGGQRDLFEDKVLRQCNPESIAHDPIRALRAVRQSMQLGLRMEAATRAAARAVSPALVDVSGNLAQPERVRDELFKLLMLPRPASALRLLHTLDLLGSVVPVPLQMGAEVETLLENIDALSSLLSIIGPARDDNTAADLTLGMAVMVLDRYRRRLQEHLTETFADGRSRVAVVLLGALAWLHEGPWGSWLCLSNAESRVIDQMRQAMRFGVSSIPVLTDRLIYRYFHEAGKAGIDGLLLALAEYLADHRPTPDPQKWGKLLETIAAPLLEAYFERYQQVIDPPPLLSGNDLQQELSLEPGPRLGQIVRQLREEQAAGEVRSQAEALEFARHMMG
jgi:tRNA nucleotidyltransferase/poly(A) polymerase